MPSYDEKARAFHEANPAVFEELRSIALGLVAKGHKHFGIRLCWEVARWQRMLKTTDTESAWKLNDHYHAFYARLLMEREPELAGVFELRRGADEPVEEPEPEPEPAREPPREQLPLWSEHG